MPEPYDTDDPAMEEAVRGALRRESARQYPSDRYSQIHDAAVHRRRTRRAVGLVGVAAGLVVVLGVGAAVAINRAGDEGPVAAAPMGGAGSSTPLVPTPPVPPPSTTASAPDARTQSPSPSAGLTADKVPVFWVGKAGSPRLFREFQNVPDKGDPVVSAVSALLTEQPNDPDYEGSFTAGGEVRVTRSGDDLSVDLPRAAFGETILAADRAEAAIQSVVWTATATAQTEGTVTITIDGSNSRAWSLVEVGQPTRRDDGARNDIWLLQPYEGQQVKAGPLTVSGTSRSFEGTLLWTVTDEQGIVVQDGVAAGGANADFGRYSFVIQVQPGRYEIAVRSEDASGGGNDVIDTKTITVT